MFFIIDYGFLFICDISNLLCVSWEHIPDIATVFRSLKENEKNNLILEPLHFARSEEQFVASETYSEPIAS